jgi:shikimate kinase/3-dehydroquinate synthase
VGERAAGNIILTGFSYTGKTEVGRSVAGKLGWGFVDTDDEIVKLAGKPVADIFAQDGEGRFRDFERDLLGKACRQSETVVSTGGGAVMDAGNRELMMDCGVVICLDAKPSTILRRMVEDVENAPGRAVRPLLSGPDPLGRIEELKSSRQPYYALADWTVNTDNLTVEEAAAEVIRGWRYGARRLALRRDPSTATAPVAARPEGSGAACIVATATASYPVFVGWGILDQMGARMKEAGLSGRALVVSDDQVFPLHGERLEGSLAEAGFVTYSTTVPSGERSKSLDMAVTIYDWLVERHVERGDTIVALGGGVVGDLAGFAAATFLRGVPLVQAPTSLMGMVDSAIGGKVAVNHPRGKNLIGAFYQPRLVLADVATLATLPARELTSGWAEVVKHAMIRDPELLELLEARCQALLRLEQEVAAHVVARSASIKAGVVSRDEKEQGLRVILNYGHTIAHGLEAATEYGKFLHGEAVAIGMTAAAAISRQVGMLPQGIAERQGALLRALGLPTDCPGVDMGAVMKAIELDKKTRRERVRWVLLEGIGRPAVRDDIPDDVVLDAVRGILHC